MPKVIIVKKQEVIQYVSKPLKLRRYEKRKSCERQYKNYYQRKSRIIAKKNGPCEKIIDTSLIKPVCQEQIQNKLYFDGSCSFNPGGYGKSAAILNSGEKTYSFTKSLGKFPHMTCNIAEWEGFLLGIKECIKLGIRELLVYGDSELIVKQVTGEWACHAEHLIPFLEEWKGLSQKFDKISVNWIPRKANSLVDELTR